MRRTNLKTIERMIQRKCFLFNKLFTRLFFSRIAGATTSKHAWTIFQNEFQGSTKVMVVKLQALRNQFETLFMKNNETVHDFLSRVTTITSKMKAYGEQITDETIVSKVLRSLPSKFDHVFIAIEESKDFYAFSFDELMGSLQSHELIKEEAEVKCVVEVEAKVGNKVEAKVGNDHNIEIASNAIIMESVRSMFKELDESYKIKVRLRDNKKIQVKGKGTVAVKSTGLTDDLETFVFEFGETDPKNRFETSKNVKIELDFNKSKTLTASPPYAPPSTETKDDTSGLGTEQGTRWLLQNVPMSGSNMFLLNVSDAGDYVFVADQRRCVYGKQTRQSFPVGRSSRASNYLEMSLVYFLKLKLETFENFKKFKAMVEKQSVGIRRELTAPYTLKQNGVAERKNRTVVEMARSLLKAKKLPNDFRAEAIATAVYLLNISPTKAVLNYTPHESWRAVEKEDWCRAMKEEIMAIEKNETWMLVDLPEGKNAIGLKWIYKTKYNSDGSFQKHKARLVEKGYAQQVIDFDDTFSPVARFETVRTFLVLATQIQWTVYQLDVKTAFLNGYFIEELYVMQPEGFIIQGMEDKVYILRKALYGLKQAPRACSRGKTLGGDQSKETFVKLP
ncbi:Detected protein of unknown function [Hibiscus syriacus]|uniref:Integrase catalytic domain-containing protein n=1 Tax=Hibiscus syriacus TaxID=106335 RepID=A0A6A3CFB9_HIBSY|nr:Detected protein of unknown function [Hibiscus syriacus]